VTTPLISEGSGDVLSNRISRSGGTQGHIGGPNILLYITILWGNGVGVSFTLHFCSFTFLYFLFIIPIEIEFFSNPACNFAPFAKQ
jgi:hypothetical protein